MLLLAGADQKNCREGITSTTRYLLEGFLVVKTGGNSDAASAPTKILAIVIDSDLFWKCQFTTVSCRNIKLEHVANHQLLAFLKFNSYVIVLPII